MRFIIQDRATGNKIIADQPKNQKGRDDLKAAIKQFSRLGQRGGCLNAIA